MQLTQIDARTVRVRTAGASFRLPYRLWWNGHERRPESIVVRTVRGAGDVRAFFLFATVRDLVQADGAGVTIRRSWSIASPEPAGLSVDVAFEGGGESGYFLPGAAMGCALGDTPVLVPGHRTSIPSSACLLFGGRGVLAWISQAAAPTEISVLRAAGEEEEAPLACLQVRLEAGEQRVASSAASFETACTLRMIFAPVSQLALRATAAVIPRRGAAGTPRPSQGKPSDLDAIRTGVERCLSTHLVREGGVAGLREAAASPLLSAEAGAGMGILLRRLYPGDGERGELALELADFALKGQHPSGLFYESFGVQRRAWLGAHGKSPRPLIAIAESARVAGNLLELSDLLEAEGCPSDKYRIAAHRFIDFFFDEKGSFQVPGALHRPGQRAPEEPGLAGMELFFPLARVWRRTGRDRYRKALSMLSRELARLPWETAWLPASRQGRDPDAAAALLCARIAAEARATGLEPVSGRAAAAVLAPWVYVGERDAVEEVDPVGALVDSFHRQRLLCAGAETALALRRLRPLCAGERWLGRSLDGLARLCQSFAVRVPLGTPWLLHAPELGPAKGSDRGPARGRHRPQPSRVGPIDSRRLVREAAALLELAAFGRGQNRAPQVNRPALDRQVIFP